MRQPLPFQRVQDTHDGLFTRGPREVECEAGHVGLNEPGAYGVHADVLAG